MFWFFVYKILHNFAKNPLTTLIIITIFVYTMIERLVRETNQHIDKTEFKNVQNIGTDESRTRQESGRWYGPEK